MNDIVCYLSALMETEPVLCDTLCSHLEAAPNRNTIRLLVALSMTALRVALTKDRHHCCATGAL